MRFGRYSVQRFTLTGWGVFDGTEFCDWSFTWLGAQWAAFLWWLGDKSLKINKA